MLLKRLLFSFLVISSASYVIAQQEQTLNKVVIASPNAASLAKYADFPVGYHTGTPNVSIPIYTLKEGSIELPISLSYHSGGIKLDELASWVGLGWSLNAGGVITRTVIGAPDEFGTAESGANMKGHLSHNGYNSFYMRKYISNATPGYDSTTAWFNDLNNGIEDSEPDLFYFNFLGNTGKFYFDDDGRPVTIPESDIKIEYDYTPNMYSIKSFVITAENGMKFYFGMTSDPNDIDPIEKTHNFYTGNNNLFYSGVNNTISSWYLNKIVSANGDFSVKLNYASEQYSYKSVQGVSYNSNNYWGAAKGHSKYFGHHVLGVRITSIQSSNITVYFDAGSAREDLSGGLTYANMNDEINTDAKVLDAIRISKDATACKSFKFKYDYFLSTSVGLPVGVSGSSFVDQKRLKLVMLREQTCDGLDSLKPYTFEYFNEAIPRRLSFAKDHWGFINGKTSNDRLVPTFIQKIGLTGIHKEIAGADREASWPEMRAGSLKKIVLPTGGYSEFEFEPHNTFLSYLKFEKVFRFSMSAGFDGSSNAVVQNKTFNTAGYTFKIHNYPTGESAGVNGIPNFTAYAAPGETTYTDSLITAGTYPVTLQKLNATTGNGVTMDVYEWVGTNVSQNQIVGGLRIKNITHKDGTLDTSNVNTSYSYNLSNNQSSGHLYSRPEYVLIPRSDYLINPSIYALNASSPTYYSQGYETINGDSYLISTGSIRPLETTQGNHIGYNEVKVSQSNNGHKIYRYYGSDAWDADQRDVADRVVELNFPRTLDVPSYPVAPPTTEYKRGELKYEATFNESNQILDETWHYPQFTINPHKTPAIKLANGVYVMGIPKFYAYETAKKTSQTIDKTTYNSLGTITLQNSSTLSYNSKYHKQATRSITINSKGDTLETKYKYSNDFNISYANKIDSIELNYNLDCHACDSIYLHDISIVTSTQNHDTPYWRFWDFQKKLNCLSIARKLLIQRRKEYYDVTNSLSLPFALNNAYTNAFSSAKPIFGLIKKNINAPIESFTLKNNKLANATYTNYTLSENEDVNLTSLDKLVNSSLSSTPLQTEFVSNLSINKDVRYLLDGTLQWYKGNVVESIGRDKIPTTFIWGYNNQYPVAKIVGKSRSEVLASVFLDSLLVNNSTTSDSLMRLVLSNLRALENCQVYTYTYNPLYGITSETDANGRILYYSYDYYGRLQFVKDHDGTIIKKICYNYAGQIENCQSNTVNPTLYYSAAISSYYTPNINCGSGQIPSPLLVTVPYGQFTSLVSQTLANTQAQNYAQQVANQQGTCIASQSTVYARIEYSPNWVSQSQSSQEDSYIEYTNVWLRFYSDSSCTQPVNLTQNTNFGINVSDNLWTSSGDYSNTNVTTITVNAGTNAIQLNSEFPLFGHINYYDENASLIYFERWADSYSINTSPSNFVIISPTYSSISLPYWYQ